MRLRCGRQLTLFIYVIILSAFLGLKEVAVAMSDPFGDDEIDFDTNGMLKSAYNNALACLNNKRDLAGSKLDGLDINPLDQNPLTAPPTPVSNGPTVTIKVPDGWPPGMAPPGRKHDELL